jgi:transcriptional regulator with XRE-family HTH domain
MAGMKIGRNLGISLSGAFIGLTALAASAIAAPAGAKTAAAVKIMEPIALDGILAEPAWGQAPELGEFIQFEPRRGAPASLKTVFKVLYDHKAVYIGVLCYDPEPDKIAARVAKRDGDLREDDAVVVCLDTFLDRRNCYFFMTNLLGTQFDGRFVENGVTQDATWDGFWKSAARKTEFGWSAEFAVELRSLKYQPGTDVSWGLNVGRVIPRLLENSFWAGPLESPYRVAQYGTLAGLSLEKAADKAEIIPHAISKLEEGKSATLELGLDARYAFSQSVSGNLTVNPDFATVEADQEQINLTRFELSLPEKRNFFLEGSEAYKQRIQLFYSRRIGDIYGGLKVYGKEGGFEFSALSVQAMPNDERNEDSANFSVIRLKTDVMKSSNVGFLAANKLLNGRNQGTTGLDTALNFSDKFRFTGQLALSYGDRRTDNIAFFLRPSFDSATSHFHVRYTQIGKYFGDNANAVGFIRDDNRRELDSALEKTFWVKKGFLERIAYESNYNIFWGTEGTLRSWQVDEGLNFDLKSKLSLELQHTEEYKLYEKDFRNRQTELTLGYNTREWQSAQVTYSFGRNYDLDFTLWEGDLNFKMTKDLSFEYALERVVFHPDPEGESTWIHVFRATQSFTPDLFLKAFYQVHTAIDKQTIQILFVYRFQPPFGLLQLAYQKGTARFGEKGSQGHTLFLKFAYMF